MAVKLKTDGGFVLFFCFAAITSLPTNPKKKQHSEPQFRSSAMLFKNIVMLQGYGYC